MKADHIRISFKEIEEIIGTNLPYSARNYQAWWANQRSKKNAPSETWLKVGWETADLDLGSEKVTFQKIK